MESGALGKCDLNSNHSFFCLSVLWCWVETPRLLCGGQVGLFKMCVCLCSCLHVRKKDRERHRQRHRETGGGMLSVWEQCQRGQKKASASWSWSHCARAIGSLASMARALTGRILSNPVVLSHGLVCSPGRPKMQYSKQVDLELSVGFYLLSTGVTAFETVPS